MTPQPSASELAILKALWQQSPLSGREIHQRIQAQLDWSYSSTRKTLERMQEKGLLAVLDVHGLKVFEVKVAKVETLATFARDFAKRVLEMESPLPASFFAGSQLLDEAELAELERLLKKDDHG
ncbi:BlaI/MecI/CopY family transcriptional regulator [Gallaecimonas kandeliae]|uniref:BlaI/MecI/CopY family transcriptional regulator n=1 Tax=Gallaecimonas kandeliae TaxID=3029055 RepID=UPI002648AC0F|nr:BlaI/MecI/CopY family transcriptional regulator [Gallaecimonas kandeliae]WKE67137.1 BlaI/MecI/CopY family transcriptional regulator [Gallaecimonas kandeliae]